MFCRCVIGFSIQLVYQKIYGWPEPAVKIHPWHCSQLRRHIVSFQVDNYYGYAARQRALPFGSGNFNGLVNFFTSFGYFATEDENQQVVREMARVLRPGGVFLFDYLNVVRELDKLVERETIETPSGPVEIERWFDPRDRSFNKRITIGQKRYLERVRGYDLAEISTMFAACNLTIRSAFGDFEGSAFTDSSPRLILVGSKSR